jgi:hypothetical protein
MPFTAMERFTVDPVSFRWVAWVGGNGIMRVRVSDAYRNGRGASNAKLFGVITVASQRATREVNEASLVRYLAESAWIPSLLGDPRIEWEERDAQKVRATPRDGNVTALVDMTFGERGEIRFVETHRYRDVRGTPVLTPWRGRFDEYSRMGPFVIPRSAKVEWNPPEGAIEVWRGYIIGARYRLR